MAAALALLCFAFVLLWLGGGVAVNNAVRLGRNWGASPFVISVLLLGFGTSLPEMATVVDASLSGRAQMAMANVIGSNIANTLLVLPLAALFYPLRDNRKIGRDNAERVNLIATIGAAVTAALTLYWFGGVPRAAGAVAVGLMLVYAVGMRSAKRPAVAKGQTLPATGKSSRYAAAMLLGGLALIIGGAELAVTNGVRLAYIIGISPEVMALLGIAVGTSLPEMAVVVAAFRQKHGAVAMGNLAGSNIFNLWAILGVAALVRPLSGASSALKTLDLPLMLAATAFFTATTLKNGKMSRAAAVTALFIYGFWAAYRLGQD